MNNSVETLLTNRTNYVLLGASILVFFSGLFGDITGDAVKYASITKAMMESGDYINIKDLGEPYLQKPPLLFWLTSISFTIFGFTNYAYKLIPVLLAIFSGYATYRLARNYYDESISRLASLILLTSFAYFFFHNDVHTDSVLTSLVVIGLWQMSEHFNSNSWKPFILAMTCFAAATLTKGPVGLFVPGFAVLGHLVLKNDWKGLFHWKWAMGLVIVFLLIFPGLLGLINQFGSDGLVFFFWTNNFGRISGSYKSNISDPVFYVHTFLWLFLPWSLFALAGLYLKARECWKNRLSFQGEGFTLGGILIYFLIISVASFKSPHYLMVVLPLFAVVTARGIIYFVRVGNFTVWKWVQVTIAAILLLGLFYLQVFVSNSSILVWLVLVIIWVLLGWAYQKEHSALKSLIIPSAGAVLSLAFYFNTTLLPDLFQYQSAVRVGKYLNEKNIQKKVYSYGLEGNNLNAFHFYYDGRVEFVNDRDHLRSVVGDTPQWFYVSDKALEEIEKHYTIKEKAYFPHNHLQAPKPGFINPATRKQHVMDRYLIQVQQ